MQATALKEVQTLLGGEEFLLCESPSLRLEKFVRLGGNIKRNEIDAVVSCQKKYGREIPRFLPRGAVSFIAKLESRLIVNQAGGILENAGLCLHPHFGTPYIPGSAVKGIARHAAWCEWKEEEDETKKKDIAIRIAETFGYPTGDKDGLDTYLADRGWKDKRISGSIAFLPTIPDGKGQLVTDIVNCHHPDYYADKKLTAADDESPNPQFFPTVESGSRFLFTLVPVRTSDRLADAKKWLVRAITLWGAGAKTAAGYGWFSYSEEESRAYFEKQADLVSRERVKAELEKAVESLLAIQREYPPGTILPENELSIVRQSDVDARRKFKGLEKAQELQELANILLRQVPQESSLDRLRREWEDAPENLKAILNGDDLQRFDNRTEERKRDTVTLLRELSGRGAEVWKKIKDSPKKFQKVEQAVREYCKKHADLFPAVGAVKQGKMP